MSVNVLYVGPMERSMLSTCNGALLFVPSKLYDPGKTTEVFAPGVNEASVLPVGTFT